MKPMKLHYHPVSTTSRPILFFAADHRLDLELQLVDLMTGEHLQSPFAAINPNRLVPVLDDGNFRLTESSAILKYIAERIESPAYPRVLRHRARVNERMDWIATGLSRELGYNFVYPQLYPNHRRPGDAAQIATLTWGRERALQMLTVMDQHLLGEQRFLCGDNVTLADYQAISVITLGEAVHIDYARWPNISRWIATMKDREGWAQANEAFYALLVRPLANASFEPF